MSFELSSPGFDNGEPIPDRFSAYDNNVSPPLRWCDPPAGTRSFALMVEDPDAPKGVFRHWGVWNIPADRYEIPEGAGSKPEALAQAVNDFGNSRWDGPRPPAGHGVHHYRFRLAALDVDRLEVMPGAPVNAVWDAARPHILGETELVGTYQR